jgi:hypothetical protein
MNPTFESVDQNSPLPLSPSSDTDTLFFTVSSRENEQKLQMVTGYLLLIFQAVLGVQRTLLSRCFMRCVKLGARTNN